MTGGIHIIEMQDDNQKSSCTREILEKLPEWFGNKQALDEYVEEVKGLPYYVAVNNANECIDFEPLITLTEMWDENDPCLIMFKLLL